MKQFRSEIRPFADLMQETLRWGRYPNEWKRMKDVFRDNENTQSIRNFIGKYENVTSAFAEDEGDHMVIGNTMFTKDFLITIDVDSRIIDLFVRIKLRDEDIRDLSNLPPYLQVCALMSYRKWENKRVSRALNQEKTVKSSSTNLLASSRSCNDFIFKLHIDRNLSASDVD